MASPITHAIIAATLAASYRFQSHRLSLWLLGMTCAVIPDLDAVGFWVGVPYESFWGHRGFTHSIVFALLVSVLLSRWISRWSDMGRVRLCLYCLVTMLSHSVLDAMTDGGLGVAFLSPFDQGRYFFPFRPIRVSSMSLRDLLGPHGVSVLGSELLWVWVPCGLVGLMLWWSGRRRIGINSME